MKTRYKVECVTPDETYNYFCDSYKELREYCGCKLEKDYWNGLKRYDYRGCNSKNQTNYYITKEDPRYDNHIHMKCMLRDPILVETEIFTVGRFNPEQILKVEGKKITINRAVAEKYGIIIVEMKSEE